MRKSFLLWKYVQYLRYDYDDLVFGTRQDIPGLEPGPHDFFRHGTRYLEFISW